MQRGMVIDGAGGKVLDAPASAALTVAPSLWSVRGLFGGGWRPAVRKRLAVAREELDDLEEYAAEIELPPPSPVAKDLAARLVDGAIRAFPRSYTLSPWSDGGVAIAADGIQGYGVSVFCRADGGASMYVVHPQGCIYECHYRPPLTIRAEEIVAAVKTLKPKPQ